MPGAVALAVGAVCFTVLVFAGFVPFAVFDGLESPPTGDSVYRFSCILYVVLGKFLCTGWKGVTMADDEKDEPDLEFHNEALRMMREDASKTLDRTLQKHDSHQKKAVQIIQVNGVVISLLLAASTQITLNLWLMAGGCLFVISALTAGYSLRGTNVAVGLSPSQITANIEHELTETQYLRWYLEHFYHQAFPDLNGKTADRARRVRWSLYAFLGGLLLTTSGIIIQLEFEVPINV